MMRFKLNLNLVQNTKKAVIPINYQYLLSAWIYKVLDKGNPEIASWLHQLGFNADNKQFRLFTFSKLEIPSVKQVNDTLHIRSQNISLIISFCSEKVTEPFIGGIFKEQQLYLANRQHKVMFEVNSVEKLPGPDFNNTMTYRCLSPIHVAFRNERNNSIDHLHPDHKEYEKLIIQNLSSKIKSLRPKQTMANLTDNISLKVLTEPRINGILIKEGRQDGSKLIGYNFNFTFEAPIEFQKVGYYAGFGKANSQGFGCVEVGE